MGTDLARHSVSVTGIITDDEGRTLLVQRRDNHHWEPPGGVLELGESIQDGLRREVREETGLDVEPIALTGVYKNMNRGIIALVFRCKATGGQPSTSDETEAFRWATETQICELASEAYAIRILDALHDSTHAAIRHHDGKQLL
jgi:8-oxo-dGTP diphosphatase